MPENGVARAWAALTDDGRLPLVVRSSSTVEDSASSSMAGRPRHLVSVGGRGPGLLSAREVRALVRLARRAERAFGGPQDVEWAFDRGGRLLLLQSRPVTATGASVHAVGPVLGPGPVAETTDDV